MQLLANGKQQFIDGSGAPLASGKVYFYAPGTLTPATTYQDAAGTIPNTNPVNLDSLGQAVIWGNGTFRQIVKNAAGTQIWDQIVNTPDLNAPLVNLSAAAGSALVGFQQAAASTVRTVQDKLRERFSVKDFGVKGDGVTDDAAAIQAAINYVNSIGGGILDFPAATYFVGATITLYNNVALRGQGGTSTSIYRTGSYGDTIVQNTGFAKISGFYMRHGTNVAPGNATLDYRQSNSSAHIRLINTQNSEIRGNILWRMPYGIVCDGAINTEIQDNWIQGVWDKLYPAMQEGLADIVFIGTSQHGQLAKLQKNYFSGAINSTRSRTYSDGVNTKTVSYPANVGSKNNILATTIEGLHLHGNYFGRAAETLIRLAPTAIISDVRITGNFFDDSGDETVSAQITTEASIAGIDVLGLTIQGNTFNGEYDVLRAFSCTPNAIDGGPSVSNLVFAGNNLFCHVATPIILTGVKGGVISGNVIQNYNSINVSPNAAASLTYTSAIYVGPGASNVSITGNTIGGGGNDGGDLANYCYRGITIDAGSANCAAYGNFYSGLTVGANIARGTSKDENQAYHTAAGNYEILSGCSVYVRAKPTSELSAVNLPKYPVVGQEVIVKDGKGDAASYNIIVGTADSITIDGATSVTINTAFGFKRFRYNGTAWNVIG